MGQTRLNKDAAKIRTLTKQRDALAEACKAFVDLFGNSDMRPEDECYEVYALCYKALALVPKEGE